ncbi:MAG: hypothetical protein ACLUI3_07155 [Christensenellales bacterium]
MRMLENMMAHFDVHAVVLGGEGSEDHQRPSGDCDAIERRTWRPRSVMIGTFPRECDEATIHAACPEYIKLIAPARGLRGCL